MNPTALRNLAIYIGAVCCLINSARLHAAPLPPAPTAAAEEAAPTAQASPDAATDLKFRELFVLPIGPRGLTPTAKLLSLNGKRVRIVGYMARQEVPVPGLFILSPLPVLMGDADDSLADDLPASAVFVHVDGGVALPHVDGLLRLTGTLSVGALDEADGHVSAVRLQLDPAVANAMVASSTARAAH